MSEVHKTRAWWDNQPSNLKMGHLYAWRQSLQQQVDVLTKQNRELESRLTSIEAANIS
ncbi:MAG TPA: hypothetical protein PLD10_00845 [Rhodopila sp.]|nr:hypothetical protein [Rhodopila sp.]